MIGTAADVGGWLASCRIGMEVFASKSYEEEVTDMKDSEILSLIINIISLVLSAVIVGVTIG